MKKIPVIFLCLMGFMWTGCSRQTDPGPSSPYSDDSGPQGSYVLIRGDSVTKQEWSNDYIKSVQYYLNKPFDLVATNREYSRGIGPYGEVVVNDSIGFPKKPFKGKCPCVVIQVISTTEWLLDCDTARNSSIGLIRFKSDGGLYYNGPAPVRSLMGGLVYTPSSSDVALTIRLVNNKGTRDEPEQIATGRKVTNRK